MLNIPNTITLSRLALVPVTGWLLWRGTYGVLIAVMASAAGWIDAGAWLPFMFVLVFATVAASGIQYVWICGRKALRDAR